MDIQNSLGSSDERRTKFVDALRASHPSTEACDHYVGKLEQYIDAQLAGQEYLSQFADLALHLDSCESCADAYARLYEVEFAIQTNQLPEIEQIPQPNLSFLDEAHQETVPTLGELLVDALVATTDTIRLQLSQPLLLLLQPALPAPLTRSSQGDDRYSQVLFELNADAFPESTLPIKLTAFQDRQDTKLCLVEVTVVPEGKSWPDLGGYAVHLQAESVDHTLLTDAWGVAAFVDIPVDRLAELAVEVSL